MLHLLSDYTSVLTTDNFVLVTHTSTFAYLLIQLLYVVFDWLASPPIDKHLEDSTQSNEETEVRDDYLVITEPYKLEPSHIHYSWVYEPVNKEKVEAYNNLLNTKQDLSYFSRRSTKMVCQELNEELDNTSVTSQKYDSLTYRELQKLAKEYNINAKQKKVILISELQKVTSTY